ncbi:MAG: 4Fe-4S cluster-binding domain-containing protein [Candidatus Heimdallarchaeota archaeon]|nr:4Fe-4S cluster-binding domain-containing protein [Candidatus Heimdallarchaeota archaeon]
MNRNISEMSWGSAFTYKLSVGCQQCIKGEKLVVLVSTDCSSKCFYCPLSEERKKSTFSFANERPIKKIGDLLTEASLMKAQGASMTGGDPLEYSSFSKTLEYSQKLRENYGRDFHIHVYTRGKEITEKSLGKLALLINELRFHVKNAEGDFKQIKLALKFPLDIGIEIPVIPTKSIEYYIQIIQNFESILPESQQFYFMNLNELEVSETNYRNLLAHGLGCDHENPSKVAGSEKLGLEIIKWASKHSTIPIHFCAVKAKDTVQLTNRIYRIAESVGLPSDVIISDGPDKGLLIRGEIKSALYDLSLIKEILLNELEIPEELVYIDLVKNRILTNAAILDELKDEIREFLPNINLSIIEEYPTYDNLQTTSIPLK